MPSFRKSPAAFAAITLVATIAAGCLSPPTSPRDVGPGTLQEAFDDRGLLLLITPEFSAITSGDSVQVNASLQNHGVGPRAYVSGCSGDWSSPPWDLWVTGAGNVTIWRPKPPYPSCAETSASLAEHGVLNRTFVWDGSAYNASTGASINATAAKAKPACDGNDTLVVASAVNGSYLVARAPIEVFGARAPCGP
ncbi:MAG: hypothetical protein ACYDDF_07700 [Thermoplasmatota archaeon]